MPLSTLVSMEPISGPEFTMRFNQYRAAQINVSANPGYSSAQVMAALEEVFAATMPREMGFDYNGMSFQEKVAQEGVLGERDLRALAARRVPDPGRAVRELVAAVQRAARHRRSRSSALSWRIWLRAFENNVFAQIGLVTLIGLAAKNAILIVEFAKVEYEKGKSAAEAALAGARLRLRPILMTAFAFILGVVPLAISSGSGAEARKLLGTAVIGGMLAASLIAIFLIPVSFYVVERLASRGEPEPAPPPEAAPAPVAGGRE